MPQEPKKSKKQLLAENPSPETHVWRRRKGKYVLIAKAVIRYQKRKKKRAAQREKILKQAEEKLLKIDPRNIFDRKLFGGE